MSQGLIRQPSNFRLIFFFKKVNDMLSSMYIKTSFKNYILHVVQQPCVVLWRHLIFHFNFVPFYWVFDVKH